MLLIIQRNQLLKHLLLADLDHPRRADRRVRAAGLRGAAPPCIRLRSAFQGVRTSVRPRAVPVAACAGLGVAAEGRVGRGAHHKHALHRAAIHVWQPSERRPPAVTDDQVRQSVYHTASAAVQAAGEECSSSRGGPHSRTAAQASSRGALITHDCEALTNASDAPPSAAIRCARRSGCGTPLIAA